MLSWGWNGYGQLGLGDTNPRGDSSDEMGDFLPYVDLGTEFYATSMHCGNEHCCAVSTDGELKCWVSKLVMWTLFRLSICCVFVVNSDHVFRAATTLANWDRKTPLIEVIMLARWEIISLLSAWVLTSVSHR